MCCDRQPSSKRSLGCGRSLPPCDSALNSVSREESAALRRVTGKFRFGGIPAHVNSVRMGDFRELLFGTGQSWPRHGNYETGKYLNPTRCGGDAFVRLRPPAGTSPQNVFYQSNSVWRPHPLRSYRTPGWDGQGRIKKTRMGPSHHYRQNDSWQKSRLDTPTPTSPAVIPKRIPGLSLIR